jgi:uncharacterized membrane protein YeaQ/YmgE (transglycosylase-associated protein family)
MVESTQFALRAIRVTAPPITLERETIVGILIWFLVGLLAGALARVLVPGKDPMGWVGTLILGLIGSLVGGFLGNLVSDGDFDVTSAGLIGSVIGAVVTLLIYRSLKNRST